MIWGIKDNQRIKAIPKDKATCELCQGELIAKCGEVKIWHWAHKSNKECDNWWEPESEWHINWKNEFPEEQQEIKIGKHRADIKTKTGTIIELQKSSISLKDIREREEFYGEKLIWLLDGKTIAKNFAPFKSKRKIEQKWFSHFEWKWQPSIIRYAAKPIFIDMNINGIFKIQHNQSYTQYKKEQFLQLYGEIFKSKIYEDGKQTNLL